MNKDVSTAAAPAKHPLNLMRLLLVAALLPAAIATVDYLLLGATSYGGQFTPRVIGQFAWYVVQVGLVGLAAGLGISHPVLRWLVFGWVLLLINLLAAVQAMNADVSWSREPSMSPAALIAGQMGLCVVWAFFGDTRWTWRWPAMIVAAGGLYFLWLSFGNHWGQQMWTELLILQVMTLSTLCLILRLSGFRLLVLDDEATALESGKSNLRPLQFGIKHVLIWTTALAILLGIAKGMDLLRWQVAQELVRGGLVWKLTVATASAMVIIVALWAALGRGHWLMRYSAVLVFTLSLGSALATWSGSQAAAIRTTAWTRWSAGGWDLLRWYEVGWSWLGWLFLSGGLLAATLIILRVLGYRLVRIRRIAPVAAAGSSHSSPT